MKLKLLDTLFPIGLTLLVLLALEIVATTVLPMFGVSQYRLPFNILIVLYIGFKLETPAMAVMILVVQYFHSFFTIEGWGMGTFAGVLICIIISYLRDLMHLTSATLTILLTMLFQMVWFVILSLLIYLRWGDWNYILEKFWRFIPESIMF